MLSATASQSATCFQFEEKQPSVHAVSLAHIAPGLSRPGDTQAFMVSLSAFVHPVKTVTFCLVREVDKFSHGTGFAL